MQTASNTDQESAQLKPYERKHHSNPNAVTTPRASSDATGRHAIFGKAEK